MARMQGRLIGVAAAAWVVLAVPAGAQLRTTQDFERLKPGTDGSPALRPLGPGWVVESGRYLQTGAEGRYDVVSLLPTYLRGRVLLRTRLAHLSEFAGGGLVFSASSTEGLEHAHMVRFDGAQELLYGSFRYGIFEPDGRLFVPRPLAPGAWIELAIEIDEPKQRYAVKVNGELVGRDLALRYPAGFAGLQVSNGRVAFDDVYAEIQRDHDRHVRWPGEFALFGDAFAHVEPVNGRLLAADREDDGDLALRNLASDARGITALTTRPAGGFAALERRTQRVRYFDAGGREERATALGAPDDLGAASTVDGPVDIAADAAGRVHVLSANGALVVLDELGRSQSTGVLPSERLGEARFERLALRGDGRGLIFAPAAQLAVETRLDGDRIFYGAAHAIPADLRDAAFARAEAAQEAVLFLACGARIEARRFSERAGLAAAHEIYSSDTERLDAIALEVSPAGWIGVADRANQRFLRLPPELSRAEPRWSFEAGGELRASWTAPRAAVEIEAELTWSDESGRPRRETAAQGSSGREQLLEWKKLPRGTSLHLSLPSSCWDSVPPRASARRIALRSPAPAGEVQFVRLPVLALVYTDVRHPATSEALLPEPEPLSADERARIEAELREGALFYWRNSCFRLWLDLAIRFVDEPLEAGAIHADREPEGEPLPAEIEARARALQLELEAHAGVLVVSARRRYEISSGAWELQGRGGGLTIGPEARGYALSWWSVPALQGGNHWLLVHEFHHQLDAHFAAVGHPEYWFNHFSPTIGTAARFGEHHDGNAYLLRAWPEWKWWALLERPAPSSRRTAFGELASARDADGDGFPDDDPRLPLDERRFGSSPEHVDTDGDGLSDTAEALLVIGSEAGGAGWTQAVFAARPGPRLRDSDGDGIEDARDPEPLYPIATEIPAARSPLAVDGARGADEAPSLLAVADPHFALELGAAHGDGALHLVLRVDRAARVELLLDGRDDGWFQGRENYRLRLDASGAKPSLELFVQDAATPGRWPFDRSELSSAASLAWKAVRDADGATLFELSLPTSAATGFRVAPGVSFGLALAVATPESERARRGYLSVFEPHRFVRFRCGE